MSIQSDQNEGGLPTRQKLVFPAKCVTIRYRYSPVCPRLLIVMSQVTSDLSVSRVYLMASDHDHQQRGSLVAEVEADQTNNVGG